MPIPVFRPFIKRKDMDAVLTCLVSDNLGPGFEADAFVNEVMDMLNLDAGIAVREPVRGLELAFRALLLPKGARVAVSVLAPSMYEKALIDIGLVPVFIDCSEKNPCLSMESLLQQHAIEPLAAVIANCSMGFIPDLRSIQALGVKIVEDITEAFGMTGDALLAGTVGDIVVLSLEPRGIITSGGGFLVMARGKPDATGLESLAGELPKEVFLPDMNAALGRTQMKELPQFVQRRQDINQMLIRAAMRGKHLLLTRLILQEGVPYSFSLVVQSPVTEVQAYARKKNVDSEQAFAESILKNYDGQVDFEPMRYPKAYGLMLRCLAFPLYPGLSIKELEIVEKVIATLP